MGERGHCFDADQGSAVFFLKRRQWMNETNDGFMIAAINYDQSGHPGGIVGKLEVDRLMVAVVVMKRQDLIETVPAQAFTLNPAFHGWRFR